MRKCGWLIVMLLLLAGEAGLFLAESLGKTPIEAYHRFHLDEDEVGDQLTCPDCHQIPSNPARGEEYSFSNRPYHSACEDCHDDDFENDVTAGIVCRTCHTGIDQDVAVFPTANYTMAHFSHAKHVDPRGRVDAATGVRLDCISCHKGQQETDPQAALGSHPECTPCHTGAQAAAPELRKDGQGCLDCHSLDKIDRNLAERRRGGHLAFGPWAPIQTVAAHGLPQADVGSMRPGHHGLLRLAAVASSAPAHAQADASPPFSLVPQAAPQTEMQLAAVDAKRLLPRTGAAALDPSYWDILPVNHGRHVRNRDGSAIDCVACHPSILDSDTIGGQLSLPTMKECASCHENASLVGQEYLIENCQVCHKTITADMRPLARDGISPSIVHSEAFRRHHEEAARAEDNQCRYCHVETLNAQQDNCSGCHSAMQPRNHRVVRFNETTHGRLAAMDRKACATCHTSDSCNICHNIPPRSHLPLALFRQGSTHRTLAMINLRSCFTCHTFENTCMECHSSVPR